MLDDLLYISSGGVIVDWWDEESRGVMHSYRNLSYVLRAEIFMVQRQQCQKLVSQFFLQSPPPHFLK